MTHSPKKLEARAAAEDQRLLEALEHFSTTGAQGEPRFYPRGLKGLAQAAQDITFRQCCGALKRGGYVVRELLVASVVPGFATAVILSMALSIVVSTRGAAPLWLEVSSVLAGFFVATALFAMGFLGVLRQVRRHQGYARLLLRDGRLRNLTGILRHHEGEAPAAEARQAEERAEAIFQEKLQGAQERLRRHARARGGWLRGIVRR